MRFVPFALCGALFVYAGSARAAGKPFNPDISVNFLGLAQYDSSYSSDRTQLPHNGLSLQEAEVQFLSDVDPYFRASALFSISQKASSSDFGIDPEEVFLESISLPYVTVKAGKFKEYLGKHNALHTHAWPFIDQPLINNRLLGSEGLNENGVSAAALAPFVPWYLELTLQAFTLANDTVYNYYGSGQFGGLVHLKNLWDLSDDTTLELGISGTEGKNQFGNNASVVGSDLTVKWRPAEGGKYHALIWSSEFLYGRRPGLVSAAGDSLEKLGGLATWLQWQAAERWWAQARFENVGSPHSSAVAVTNKETVLVAFAPSEFSALRLQYDWTQDQSRAQHDHGIAFQYNVTIGAHPAHSY